MVRTMPLKRRIEALEEELTRERTARTSAEKEAADLRCDLRHANNELVSAREKIERLSSSEPDFSLHRERQARAAAAVLEEAFTADSPQVASAAAQRAQALMALEPRCFIDPQVFCDVDTNNVDGFSYGVLTAAGSMKTFNYRCDAKAFLVDRHGLTSTDADQLLREHEESARRRDADMDAAPF